MKLPNPTGHRDTEPRDQTPRDPVVEGFMSQPPRLFVVAAWLTPWLFLAGFLLGEFAVQSRAFFVR